MVIQGSRREYFCVLISSKSCTLWPIFWILEKSPGADPPRARLPADLVEGVLVVFAHTLSQF